MYLANEEKNENVEVVDPGFNMNIFQRVFSKIVEFFKSILAYIPKYF